MQKRERQGQQNRWLLRWMAWGITLALLMLPFFTLPMANVHADPTEAGGSSLPEDIASFPESYHSGLLALKTKHPNWQFVPMNVMDWNTALNNEMRDGKSLINYRAANCLKEGKYDQGNWYFASKGALAYYMDPRNSLTEERIFQFEQLSYNAQYHTVDALETMLRGTFMGDGKKVPGTAMSYAVFIHACGAHPEVLTSPFHLAARILQEQGRGESALISGTYPGYEGYYNYFNIGATGTTNQDIIVNGLEYAKKKWGKEQSGIDGFGAYNAILEGSKFIASSFIAVGQDTLYLQKFNVTASAPFTHQYMQNIVAPMSEAGTIRDFYEAAGALEIPFTFRIPVYQNMPAQACQMPTSSTNVVLEIPSDKNDPYNYTGNTVMIDGEPYECESYYNSAKETRRLIATLPDGTAMSVAIELRSVNGDLKRAYYWTLEYKGNYYVATEVSEAPVLEKCEISFLVNGGTGSMDSQWVLKGKRFLIPECMFEPKEGYIFYSWDWGRPGDEITITGPLELTAVWVKRPISVTVSASRQEGGTVSVSCTEGNVVSVSAVPAEGYVFRYWTKGIYVVSDEPVYSFLAEEDTDLVAVFAKVSE
ncbi:MAG: hypothetical protein E7295_08270 [Lachnospiraceae bacterium]|nr:hypothetical protein [Lachnospiraceae bacterium]